MRKIALYVLFTFLTLICACSFGGVTNAWQSVCGLVIREDGKTIPIVYYGVGKTAQFVMTFHSTDEQNTGFYFAEANANNDYYTLIKKAGSYALHYLEPARANCIYKNGKYAMQAGYDSNICVYNSNFDLMYTLNISTQEWGTTYDLTSDGSRFLNGYNTTWYEYNTNTSTNNVISSTAVPVEAKYSPADETLIYYFTYSGQELHSIKNDGTNDQLILSGYYINHIAFNPAGDKIIFSTYDKIYSVNLNGTGVTELASYALPNPSDTVLFVLSYNKIVYVDRITQNAIHKINF